MRKSRLFCALGLLVLSRAAQGQSDPYASETARVKGQEYQSEKSDVMASVQKAWFAARCQVIDETSASAFTFSQGHLLQDEMIQSGIDDLFGKDLQKAAQAGGQQAKTDGCAYWHEHPDEVVEMRDAVNAATAP